MRTVVLWGLLALLYQHTLVSSHVLGRSYSPSDLAQLKSLLGKFEETLSEATQEEDTEADYEGVNQEPVHSQDGPRWSSDQEGGQQPSILERQQPAADSHSWTPSQRSRLQELLMSTRSRVSGCFGARMDRIGNASGLGCNNGRG
ncbi:natriuretic peptides A [Myripristis murdjan]|nr:natriuretic peptides A-like [Myripristis murdjan]